MKKYLDKKYLYIIVALFIFALFIFISYKMPISGDDWGYCMAGESDGALKTAIQFYQTWSGRFFSEIWDAFFASHKFIWNFINALLFTGAFLCVYKLSSIKNKTITSILLILATMLTVPDAMRMESYTWVTGSIYPASMLWSLIYFVIAEELFINDEYSNKVKVLSYLSNIFLIVTGLMIENIAATMIVGIIILIIYAYFKKKKALKYLIINLIFSVTSFLIMRSSPGSASRQTEHLAWNEASLFGKISSAYPNFLDMSFINNKYAISIFSIVLILALLFSKKKMNKIYKCISICICLLGIISVFSYLIKDGVLNVPNFVYSFVFWPIYVINAFIIIYLSLDDGFQKDKALFMLMIGGCSVLVLLYSPIYGSRHAIYLIYYLMITMLIVFENTDINNKIIIYGMIAVCAILSIQRSLSWISLYKEIGNAQIEREQIIQYYIDNPDVEEAWIPRFPVNSAHGVDIEIGDTYHFETFKEYFKLPQDADKIVFYWEDASE